MPTKEHYFDERRYFEYSDTVIFFDDKNRRVQLRRTDLAGNYNRLIGRFNNSGTVVLPNFRADKITELYSFEENSSGSGTVDYQLSNDNGVTWQYYSGTAWGTAGATDFNTLTEVDANISDFILNYPKEVRVKARLRATVNTDLTPMLSGVFINYEHDADYLEDVQRTLKRFLDQRLLANFETRLLVSSGTTSYTIELQDGSSLYNVKNIYNITIDTERQMDLNSSFTSAGALTLSIAQVSGTLLVSHQNTVPIYLGAEVDIFDSVKPSIAITHTSEDEAKEIRYGDDIVETSLNLSEARIRPHPDRHENDFVLFCQHGSQRRSTKLAEAVKRLFASKKILFSHGTGQKLQIKVVKPVMAIDKDIYTNAVGLKVYGHYDINKQRHFDDSSGVATLGNQTFAGSGTEQRYDTVPLVVTDGIIFNIESTKGV